MLAINAILFAWHELMVRLPNNNFVRTYMHYANDAPLIILSTYFSSWCNSNITAYFCVIITAHVPDGHTRKHVKLKLINFKNFLKFLVFFSSLYCFFFHNNIFSTPHLLQSFYWLKFWIDRALTFKTFRGLWDLGKLFALRISYPHSYRQAYFGGLQI